MKVGDLVEILIKIGPGTPGLICRLIDGGDGSLNSSVLLPGGFVTKSSLSNDLIQVKTSDLAVVTKPIKYIAFVDETPVFYQYDKDKLIDMIRSSEIKVKSFTIFETTESTFIFTEKIESEEFKNG